MNPITIIALAESILKYGPTVITTLNKLRLDIASGKGDQPVSDAMWEELDRLASQNAGDIYARLGITPPKPPGGV